MFLRIISNLASSVHLSGTDCLKTYFWWLKVIWGKLKPPKIDLRRRLKFSDAACENKKEEENMVRIINGRLHQGHIMSNVAGYQCTAIGLVAILLLASNNGHFTSNDVDKVVREGSNFYEQILARSLNPIPRYLGHWELPSQININNELLNLVYYTDIFYGVNRPQGEIVQQVQNLMQSTSEDGSTLLEEAIQRGIAISDFMLLTIGVNTISISRVNGRWYLFDSHGRDVNGLSSDTGFASIMIFEHLDELTIFLNRYFSRSVFNLTPVIIDRSNVDSNSAQSGNHDLINVSLNCSHSGNSTISQRQNNRCSRNKRNVNISTENESNKKSARLTRNNKFAKKYSKYEESLQQIITAFCVCCEKFLFPEQVRICSIPALINPFQSNGCDGNIYLEFNSSSTFCSVCASSLVQNRIPSVCKYNNLETGKVPECIKVLGFADRRMIAQIQSFMTILMLPGGQFAEKGLAIHFPLNVSEYCNQLSSIKDECFVVLSNKNEDSDSEIMSYRKVANYKLVKKALQWLKKHNHLYKDFPDIDTLNNTGMSPEECCNSENMDESQLFNSYIKDRFGNVTQCSVIPTDFVLPDIDINSLLSSGKKISIPTKFDQPVWLSDISHGEELAYPALFPVGTGGINNERVIPLTTLKYFQSRLYNRHDRWRKDIPYLMYAVNNMEQSKLANDIEIQMRIKKGQSLTNSNLESAQQMSNNSFMFMKNIRGTVAYWTNVLHDLLAMVKCIGPPTLFMTLSADDCHWPELDMLLTGRSYEECIHSPSCSAEMIKDPLLTSIHFERRWKSLFRDVIKGSNPPFGSVTDHFARIEYQNRGSPHLHIFLWVDKAPDLHKSSSDEITKYIDTIIRTTVPAEEEDEELFNLVSRLQVHHHTATCNRRRSCACRFGFPRPVTEYTHLLQNVNITNPSNRGRFYETTRTEKDVYINAYNEVILRRWRANMDIQMVSGSHGLAYYVCSYIAKAEPDDLKQALGKVIQDVSSQPQPYSMKKKLYLIGNCVLKSRRLSAQEAAARLGHLQLIWKSREVIFLNTRPLHQRYRILKPKHIRDHLPENSTDIFCSNILNYYLERPADMENINLFKFASHYKLSQSKNLNGTSRSLPRFKLQSSGKIMQQRRHPAVIRTPAFKPDSDEYFFSILMLYLPYRDETNIIGSFSTAKQAFINKHHLLTIDNILYSSYLHDIERVVRIIRLTNEDLGVSLAPNTNETHNACEDVIAEEFDIMNNMNIAQTNESIPLSFSSNVSVEGNIHNLQVNILSTEEINQQMERLNHDQQSVLNVVQAHFNNHCLFPLHIFISGEGGTGKSFLIRTLVEWIRCYTAPFVGANPVLVCGPTGMSAKNIQGKTLHSIFKLPVQHGRQPEYSELSSRVLQQIRKQFHSVHTLVVDEVSMVSNVMLTHIHRRLCAIKQNSEFFGGLNVILIGDFFQLKPIRGQFAFTNTLLWSLFDNYILNVNMRQSTDSNYSMLLHRIRHGEITRSDIDLLMSRIITDDDEDFIGALRVFPTVKEVTEYNSVKQGHLNKHYINHNAVHEFHSSDIQVNDDVNNFLPNDDRDAGGLPRTLSVSIGTRVMLIRNIATDQGLVNGALGFIKALSFENERLIRIYVQFDDESIGSTFYSDEHSAIYIEPLSQEFYFKGRSIYRTQFPLIPAWACTIHKVQGISTDKIVVSLGRSVFAEGQFYVALSRVRTLQGLGILRLDPTKVKANQDVVLFYNQISLHCKHSHN